MSVSQKMGVKIQGTGTDCLVIEGGSQLKDTEFTIPSDRIAAGTYLFAGAITRGRVTLHRAPVEELTSILQVYEKMGGQYYRNSGKLVTDSRRIRYPVPYLETEAYPGFPTDMQPQITVTLALARGTSIVTESIFENRFKYVDELARMGGNIKVEGNVAVIDGVKNFSGAAVNAPDLRAGAALVIAGLAADGYTVVDEIGYIQRGYECFEEKLRGLGAMIEKVDSEKEAMKFRLRVG